MGTVDELIWQLRLGSEKERYQAAIALGRLGDPKAVSALLKKLSDYAEQTPVRGAAARSIGQIADLNAIPKLLDILELCDVKLMKPILEAVGEILGRTFPVDAESREIYSRAVDTLIQTVENKWSTVDARAAAAEALGKTRDPKAVPALAAALENSNWEVSSAAQESLQPFVLTHPDAILRLPIHDRNRVGRALQSLFQKQLSTAICK
jgi:HEAT repeat protein